MKFVESFRIAWMALLANKMRALLTMLGIIIGVGAVVGMLSIGNGLSQWFESEFDKLGVGVFYISPAVDTEDVNSTQRPRLTLEDIEAITQPGAAPAVAMAAVEYDGGGQVISAGSDRYYYTVKGVTPEYFQISSNSLGTGRFLDDADERNRARVALVGKNIADTLLGGEQNAIGQRLTINNVGFEVVGVLTTKAGIMGGSNPSDEVYIPYQTAIGRLFRNQVDSRVNISQATIKAQSRDQIDTAIQQVTALLRTRHQLTYQDNDFSIVNPEQIAQQAQATLVGFNAFLGTIGGISLLVGGIGIMNIMLVSVTQRTREIGLRKAVGARRIDILVQFLIESLVLSLSGGILGVSLGYLLSLIGNFVLTNIFQAQGASASVTMASIILATSVSAGIGIGFGLFPALRAARLDPIRALRAE